jgi:hypothetical protein
MQVNHRLPYHTQYLYRSGIGLNWGLIGFSFYLTFSTKVNCLLTIFFICTSRNLGGDTRQQMIQAKDPTLS